MNKDEEKEVGLGDMIAMLTGAMQIVSEVSKSKGILTEELIEDAKVVTDIFRENFSEELLKN